MNKLVLGLFVLIGILLGFTYWYVTTSWKTYYTDDEMKAFAKEINKAPKLSDTFYFVYDKLHNNDRQKSMTSIYTFALWNDIILNNPTYQTAWFERAAYSFPKKKDMGDYADFKVGWGLEKVATPEKCFDYVMSKENKQLMDIDSTLKHVTQLTDTTEILEYLVLVSAPSIYLQNPEKLKPRVSALKMKLKE